MYFFAGTRFFACQNPLQQGGSRRGLPRSFLNRFIQVYINLLNDKDLHVILRAQFPQLPDEILHKMIKFNASVTSELENRTFGNRGGPWEYNLRDITRWCEATLYHFKTNPDNCKKYQPENLVNLIYCDRLRTVDDRGRLREIFRQVFECDPGGEKCVFYVNKDSVYVGDVRVERNNSACNVHVLNQDGGCLVLRKQLPVLRSLMYCINMGWMSIVVSSFVKVR